MHSSRLTRLWGLIFLFGLRSDLGPHIGANPLVPDGYNRMVAVKIFK